MTKRITKGQRVRYRTAARGQARGTVVHIEQGLLWVRPDRPHLVSAGQPWHGLDLVSVNEVKVITGYFGTSDAPDRELTRRDLESWLSEGPSDAETRRVRAERLTRGDGTHCQGERPECISCDAPCIEDPKTCRAFFD